MFLRVVRTYLLLLFLVPAFCFAEVDLLPGSIQGKVINQSTREPIAGANVILVGSKLGAATDINGFFEIKGLQPAVYHVQASAIGYEKAIRSEISVLPDRATNIELRLQPSFIEGEEVTVTAGYFQPSTADMPVSTRSLGYEEVRRAPGAVADPQRMIQVLPGVAGADDQNNEIVVRGGSPYENLTIIDGIELDNINHFGYQSGTGGPITMVNAEYLRELTFASGGFSARYGDRMSSIMELELREGNRQRVQGNAEISMAGAGGLIEGPLPGGNGSYIFSARKSYLDLIKSSIGLTAVPEYWDTQSKITYDINNRNSVDINVMYGDDKIFIDDTEEEGFSRGAEVVDYTSDRLMLGSRLRTIWGNIGYSEIIVATNHVNYYAFVEEANPDSLGNFGKYHVHTSDNSETFNQLTLFWKGKAFGKDEWSTGVTYKPISFNNDVWSKADTTVFNDNTLPDPLTGQYDLDSDPDTLIYDEYILKQEVNTAKYSAFVQYNWRPSSRISVTGGLRYDGLEYSDNHKVGPRLSAKYQVSDKVTLSGSTGIYYQAHPLQVYNNDPDGANKNLDHSHSTQYVLGASWLPRPSTLISVETYYKDYDKLLTHEQDYIRKLTGDYSFQSYRYLAIRDQESYGVEFFAQQKLHNSWYGSLSYSLGYTTTDVPAYGLRDGQYDFRNVLTLVLGKSFYPSKSLEFMQFRKSWYGWWANVFASGDETQVSTRFRYISGRPYTMKKWYVDGQDSPDTIYEEHWAKDDIYDGRYPDYARWDVRVDNKEYFGRIALITFFEVENVLGRKNIADYIYADDGEIDNAYQFGFFFVGGIRLEF